MDIIKMIGIGLTGAIAALIVKQSRPEIAVVISIATSALLFLMIAGQLTYLFEVIHTITDRLGIDTQYVVTIIRIIGIAYLTQLGADLCRDAGQTAIATKLEIAGKILIITLSIPIVVALVNLLVGLLPA